MVREWCCVHSAVYLEPNKRAAENHDAQKMILRNANTNTHAVVTIVATSVPQHFLKMHNTIKLKKLGRSTYHPINKVIMLLEQLLFMILQFAVSHKGFFRHIPLHIFGSTLFLGIFRIKPMVDFLWLAIPSHLPAKRAMNHSSKAQTHTKHLHLGSLYIPLHVGRKGSSPLKRKATRPPHDEAEDEAEEVLCVVFSEAFHHQSL